MKIHDSASRRLPWLLSVLLASVLALGLTPTSLKYVENAIGGFVVYDYEDTNDPPTGPIEDRRHTLVSYSANDQCLGVYPSTDDAGPPLTVCTSEAETVLRAAPSDATTMGQAILLAHDGETPVAVFGGPSAFGGIPVYKASEVDIEGSPFVAGQTWRTFQVTLVDGAATKDFESDGFLPLQCFASKSGSGASQDVPVPTRRTFEVDIDDGSGTETGTVDGLCFGTWTPGG